MIKRRKKIGPKERFEKDLNKANLRRVELHEKGEFSVPSESGKLAILFSDLPNQGSPVPIKEQRKALLEYALRIASERETMHERGAQIYNANYRNVRYILDNKNVSDIVTIGAHGNLGRLSCEEGSASMSWLDLANWASHLKRGSFEHRQNNQFPRNEIVAPLGAFILSNPANFLCAPGVVVPDHDPGDAIEFRPLLSYSEPLINQLVDMQADIATRQNVDMTGLPRKPFVEISDAYRFIAS